MATIDETKVGELFKDEEGNYWKLISYCRYPSATMQKVGSGEKIGGAVGSLNLSKFRNVDEGIQKELATFLSQIEENAGRSSTERGVVIDMSNEPPMTSEQIEQQHRLLRAKGRLQDSVEKIQSKLEVYAPHATDEARAKGCCCPPLKGTGHFDGVSYYCPLHGR